MSQTLHTPSWSEPDQPVAAISPFKRFAALPEARGLYNPEQEKDACGLAIIATLRGEPGYDIVDAALTALRNLEHRGAVGADEGTGDGAGLLMQIPDEFFRAVTEFELPPPGQFVAGTAFLPAEKREADAAKAGIEGLAADEGLTVLGWREVPVVADLVGAMARACMPYFSQPFLASATSEELDRNELDSRAWRIRKRAQNKFGVYFPSLSSRTIVY
ncbi:MAG TPA: glutamate synthase subunit alpha, partial [Arthrobacter sp.]|nr:glutamate synthase subunit alpha [Arthrobacter sp.]